MLLHAIHGSAADRIAQGILFGCFMMFALFWAVTALWTKRTIERGGWSWRLIAFLLAMAAFEFLRQGGGLGGLAGQMLWQRGIATDVLADVLAIGGLAMTLWARVTLGSNWSGSVVLKENHELMMRGPYAFVRHPIYTGLLAMILGTVIFYGVVAGVVWFVLAFGILWLKSRAEESLMTRHFPAEYPAYRGRVKALVPFVF